MTRRRHRFSLWVETETRPTESKRGEEHFMERAIQLPARVLSREESSKPESGLFSTESVLNLQKLTFAGSPVSEVLTNIAQLVEAQAEGMSCTIWLPDEDGKKLYCAVAPSLPGFCALAGTMAVGPKGGSCGTAIYRKEPVYVTNIVTDPVWDNYRDRTKREKLRPRR
jgi:formate hydrogenlyase transcriptional activator